jgi:hypothetical protein
MKDNATVRKPFDREMEGPTVEAHGVMVTPVARVRGMADAKNEPQGRWRFAWTAIRPVKMIVRDRTGETHEVKLASTEGRVLGAMAAVGAIVAVVMILISAKKPGFYEKPGFCCGKEQSHG